MLDRELLKRYQSLPLIAKEYLSKTRIRQWYEHWNGQVMISCSGGKDSTVLAHLVHDLYPEVPLVFCNTGLEFPEIQAFAKKLGADFTYPKMKFSEIISKYGYPIITKENAEAIYYARRIRNGQSFLTADKKRLELNGMRVNSIAVVDNEEGEEHKSVRRNLLMGGTGKIEDDYGPKVNVKPSLFNKKKWLPLCQETQFMISHECCSVMKKNPLISYQRKYKRLPYIGNLAEESRLREQAWLKHGCNVFDKRIKKSVPMSFWTEQDVLSYIYNKGLEIAEVYGEIVCENEEGQKCNPTSCSNCQYRCTGYQRTGCIFCGFGCHLDKKGESRFQSLAKTHPKQYEYCMGGGQWVDNPAYDPSAPRMDGNWLNWNPKKIWVPSKKGLGMKYVFDECNRLYGKGFIRYD